MIIKSSQRAGHTELAAHLMKSRDIDGTPQTVTISGSRDLMNGNDVHQALGDMAILALASSRCQKDLYHVSLSPDQTMTEQDWETVWQLYEGEFYLSHLPYIEVTHLKGDHRPPHRHRVYERVDVETCKAVQLSHTRIRNELVARKIEFLLGHALTIGKHNRTIIKRLEQEGEQKMIDWMRHGHAHNCDRPAAYQNHADVQMEKRTKLPTEQVKTDLQACYAQTDTGQSFRVAIAEKGYQLAKGDQRDFVIVDVMGSIHSPRRRLGVKAKELREQWADLVQIPLAHVDDVVRQVKAQLVNSEAESTNTDAASKSSTDRPDTAEQSDNGSSVSSARSLPALRQEAEDVVAEIKEIEATIAAGESNQIDDEVLNYWQRQRIIEGAAEPERSRPRPKVRNQNGRGETSKALSSGLLNEAQLLQLQGQDAIVERQHRLLVLSQRTLDNTISTRAVSDHPIGHLNEEQALEQGIVDYQKFWQQRFKGQTAKQLSSNQAYRIGSDRWILQRLARRGYSRTQARQILLRSSPEVLNHRSNERLGYIRRIVNQVYTPHEQQIALEQQKQRLQDKAALHNDKPTNQVKMHEQEQGSGQSPPIQKLQKSEVKQPIRNEREPDIGH